MNDFYSGLITGMKAAYIAKGVEVDAVRVQSMTEGSVKVEFAVFFDPAKTNSGAVQNVTKDPDTYANSALAFANIDTSVVPKTQGMGTHDYSNLIQSPNRI